MVVKGEEGEGGLNWEFRTSRCKLLYTEWINNKVLLCSTENYIQHPIINHNGKNMKKNIYAYLNHSAVHQRPPQQSRPTILQVKKTKRKKKAYSKQKEQPVQRYTSMNKHN